MAVQYIPGGGNHPAFDAGSCFRQIVFLSPSGFDWRALVDGVVGGLRNAVLF